MQSGWSIFLVRNVGLAFAYLAMGHLAWNLSSQRGPVVALFPPAGLALVAILLHRQSLGMGVWLGSFLLNAWLGYQLGHGVSQASLLVAGALAFASLLQAFAGAALVRRSVRDPRAIQGVPEILNLLFLGGPLACLVGATLGTTTLLLQGSISPEESLIGWGSWWIGDTLGVLLMAPLALVFWPRRDFPGLPQRAQKLGPLVLTCSLFAFLVHLVNYRENERLRVQFHQEARDCLRPFQSELRAYENFVTSLASYVRSTPGLDPQTFRGFVGGIYDSNPGIQAVSWCPQVKHADRSSFEATQSSLLARPFQIYQIGTGGRHHPVDARESYFPVALIEPFEGNKGALGFDLASEGTRRSFVEKLTTHHGVLASEPIQLIQSLHGSQGLLLGHGVRGPGGEVRGVVTAVFYLPSITSALSGGTRGADLAVRLVDRSTARSDLEWLPWTESPARNLPSHLTFASAFKWAGHTLEVQVRPTYTFLSRISTWQIWALLATGLLLANLIQAALLGPRGAPPDG